MRDILEGTLELKVVSEVLKVTRKEFITQVSKLHPHPVYIHPQTSKLSGGNFVAIENFINY